MATFNTIKANKKFSIAIYLMLEKRFLFCFPFRIYRTLNSQVHFLNFSISTVFHPSFCLCLLTIYSVLFNFCNLRTWLLSFYRFYSSMNESPCSRRTFYTDMDNKIRLNDSTGTKHDRCKTMLSEWSGAFVRYPFRFNCNGRLHRIRALSISSALSSSTHHYSLSPVAIIFIFFALVRWL